jgi:hypothetical protein
VFGQNTLGTVLFATVQAVSALILYTGANTSFDGFPFWASFAAGDSFLLRQLTKCGHRSSELSLAATGAHRQSQRILVALQGDPEGPRTPIGWPPSPRAPSPRGHR